MGLVGESGSGKTMASLALMGLLPAAVNLRSGSATLDGREIIDQDTLTIDQRTGDLAMIFQHPRAALNPTMRIGVQLARVLTLNQGMTKKQATSETLEILGHVGIPGPQRVSKAYPHQLSGGMCQRVMIAMALACRPRVLIADEPTTALDVTIQAQIFDLIRDLVAETDAGVLFITHDLGAVAEMCDEVTVMFGGQVMEQGTRDAVFRAPEHPYTKYLFDSLEREVDPDVLEVGVDFSLAGCRFGHRCPHAWERCGTFPDLLDLGDDHRSACYLHLEEDRVGTA